MHLELVELMRCPATHAPGVLVASADTIVDRFITQGLLGCPDCLAEYAIRDGVTHFVDAETKNSGVDANTRDQCDPMHLAAQLGLSTGRTAYALIGYDWQTVVAMRELVPAKMVLFNSASPETSLATITRAGSHAPLGIAQMGETLPLTAGKFDGIAISSRDESATIIEQSVSALRSGGRLVAPASSPLPRGVRELVRDEQVWVAEREAVATAPISILRR